MLTVTSIIIITIYSIVITILYANLNTDTKRYISICTSLKEEVIRLHLKLNTVEQETRADIDKRSRSVIRGKVSEHLAPLLMPDTSLTDLRFVGNPIDYLYIKGTGAINDDIEQDIKIILLDIKSGKSSLNKVQRRIRDAVEAGRVAFATFNPDTKEYIEWTQKKQ